MTDQSADFATRLLDWFDQHGRHDLPWQVRDYPDKHPYKVWVSEIMLQQTQVKTVLNYFDRFMQRFPSVESLAQASWDDVAPYWAGLGYYARARNLHKAAQQVVAQGSFPHTLEGWMALSGIGRSTAGALMSLGLQQYGVIMDGNVKRVLSRHQAIAGDSMSSPVVAQLWQLATVLTPVQRNADYTQAIMDLGATLCTSKKPLCLYCPVREDCKAYQQNRVLEFPQKKAAKATPVKHAVVIIIEHEQTGQWLWQQRPSEGLWGGLYCLPIVEQTELAAFQAQFSLTTGCSLPTVKHSFTHFSWFLTPQVFKVNAAQHDALQHYFAASQWLDKQQAMDKGLPKAMLKVLGQC
ncbi:A/G-specific adenine glycosylase [Alkanindiges hydrocarboniclasticus]|uniref:Adenine DNA glycosylase n=1 Tax=Alkanindiges hydrocarboniclasticus TaxID=1907941 RepID=A0A1S8CV06_9GAMM|nr:A/G-specific adenine glycosylase [Alkanindiges hydrocarboniclasticus]ONG41071.1 A/G-specific adenine glycosylase [Alkanindiges hydrocarboniclasticus]